ncbi:MAG TPA: DMT family transporter [Bacteroidia bacterium]|nr:DMT family transporter [Bacteroidia bacterium]
MLWLLLSILTNSALLLILKAFDRFHVNTLQGIVVNYLVAGSLGFILSGLPLPLGELPHQPWSWVPPVLGVLFISIFFLLARTAQTIGVSVATVANKMSVVIPVFAAILLYHESVTVLKIAGVMIAVVAVYFTSLPKEKTGTSLWRHLLLPVIVFIGSGIIDALVNHAKNRLVPDNQLPAFISLSFLTAFCIGVIIITTKIIRGKEKFETKSIAAGIVLGLPNYFSIYGMTRALGSGIMESSALYPVNNMGIVIVSALGALLFFRERLSWKNWLGIFLSLGAIAMIAIHLN